MSGPSVAGGSNPEAEPLYVHDARDRILAGGELILEWHAETTATENLRLVVTAFTGCPDNCEANRSLGSATGPSPLVVGLPQLDADGLQVVVRVEKVDFAPGTQASPGQPIHLGGHLLFAGRAGAVASTATST